MRISDWSSDVCSSDLDPSLCRQLAFDSLVRLLNLHGDILLNSLYNFRCGVVGQISRFQCSKQFDVHPVLLLVGDGRHPAWAPAPAVRDREAAALAGGGEPICAANWGDRRSLKAGAPPCQKATTTREKRLRGAGFDAPPRALHGTEIIGFAQRAKGGGVSPPLRRQPDWPRFALAASTPATTCGYTHSPPPPLRVP